MSGQNFDYTDSTGKTKNGFGAQASAGAGDAGKLVSLNSAGNIDATMLPPGVELQTRLILASEDISAQSLVNIYDNAGVANVRNADNGAAGKEAVGFVLSAVVSGNNATVYVGSGLITGLTGLVAGTRYYTGTVGALTTTPPDATNSANAGKFVQFIGYPDSATEFSFEPDAPVYL